MFPEATQKMLNMGMFCSDLYGFYTIVMSWLHGETIVVGLLSVVIFI